MSQLSRAVAVASLSLSSIAFSASARAMGESVSAPGSDSPLAEIYDNSSGLNYEGLFAALAGAMLVAAAVRKLTKNTQSEQVRSDQVARSKEEISAGIRELPACIDDIRYFNRLHGTISGADTGGAEQISYLDAFPELVQHEALQRHWAPKLQKLGLAIMINTDRASDNDKIVVLHQRAALVISDYHKLAAVLEAIADTAISPEEKRKYRQVLTALGEACIQYGVNGFPNLPSSYKEKDDAMHYLSNLSAAFERCARHSEAAELAWYRKLAQHEPEALVKYCRFERLLRNQRAQEGAFFISENNLKAALEILSWFPEKIELPHLLKHFGARMLQDFRDALDLLEQERLNPPPVNPPPPVEDADGNILLAVEDEEADLDLPAYVHSDEMLQWLNGQLAAARSHYKERLSVVDIFSCFVPGNSESQRQG